MAESVQSESHAAKTLELASKKIALVAGGGEIPVILANQIAENGHAPFVFLISGEADDVLRKYEHLEMSTAAIGKLISTLRNRDIRDLVIVGSVKGRPKWTEFRPDPTTLRLLGKIIAGLRGGDDGLLSRVVGAIEEAGISVHGAHEIMPELLTPQGQIVGTPLNTKQQKAVNIGIEAAIALGELDAGQGCVVIGERIVALEGVEGTDNMLKRVAALREEGRLTDKQSGVLVKMCKPQQDPRVDLPTIGLSTVQNAVAAKLEGIAVHAGRSMIVDLKSVIEEAEQAGIFIHGVQAGSHHET